MNRVRCVKRARGASDFGGGFRAYGVKMVRAGASVVTATESLETVPMRVLVQTTKCTP